MVATLPIPHALEPTLNASDDLAAGERALKVLRAWQAGPVDNLPIALREAELILAEDGGHDQLLPGLITVAGFLLVNLEQHGQPAEATLQLVEAFLRAQSSGS